MANTDATDGGPPARALAPDERDAAVERLCAHFARDALTDTELERRLDLAYAARTTAELAALEADLPTLPGAAAPGPPASPAPSGSEAPSAPPVKSGPPAADHDLLVSIWGGTERKGGWTPPRRMTALTVMGGAELDFREAEFATREVSVRVVTVMGGVDVIVPPGVRVEWAGIAVMGGVTTPERVDPPGPEAPVVRISGLVCMGAVEVVERLPGESARQARKRLKRARKARRRLEAGG